MGAHFSQNKTKHEKLKKTKTWYQNELSKFYEMLLKFLTYYLIILTLKGKFLTSF